MKFIKSLLVGGAIFLLAFTYANYKAHPIQAQAWTPPDIRDNPALDNSIQALNDYKQYSLHGYSEPEYWTQDTQGRLYTGVAEGKILRIERIGTQPEVFADTQGRPLGIAFDSLGQLWVADAKKGLLKLDPQGQLIKAYTHDSEGIEFGYADALAIDANNTIYLSDASTKFKPKHFDIQAYKYDLAEHGLHGRIYKFSPEQEKFTLLKDKLQFANGVALTPDQQHLLINETGMYRTWKLDLATNTAQVILSQLPGFPDNIVPSLDGNYWVGLPSPRNSLLDTFAKFPKLRNMLNIVPPQLIPGPKHNAHIIKIDSDGNILQSLQNNTAPFSEITHAHETETHIILGSLKGKAYTVVKK